ncbi:MAG: 5-(carboxyamino)imidazole ribonucleotide synthase [Chitinophagales bacterium]|nr:5-(carboxyamino)imidazole ribonucleotide synthase [Chitinophagales bacterium]MDW8427015.1 5-(carboxyamino)imidazole ribonucleotide synthase [Chitinophagales bacterium]
MRRGPRVGIIGGGQLGRMFIEEALRYNVTCIIADADRECPAALIAHEHVVGSIAEEDTLVELARRADLLTYEIEHIYLKPLLRLEAEGKVELIPSARVLKVIQDKALQKQFLHQHGIDTADFALVEGVHQWEEVARRKGWSRFAVKTRFHGYDGRGVLLQDNLSETKTDATGFDVPAVIEEFVECEKELSVIVGCGRDGKLTHFPVVEMQFDPKANLVMQLLSPAQIAPQVEQQAITLALDTVRAFASPGLYAVELFLDKQGRVLVNEIAPRPHNSGHHTIEACFTSQYEQLLRILLGLPQGSTRQLCPAVLLNVLGPADFSGPYYFAGYEELLNMEGVYVHMYGKKESRPMRKLGHVTILGSTMEEVLEKAERVKPHCVIKKANHE